MAIDKASGQLDPGLGGTEGLGRVAAAAFVGTAIEFYDFVLYGMAAALVFGHEYFPGLGPAGALLAALSVYAVAFLARPVGAVVFGHFGDRVGRKAVLVTSLLLMGLATAAVGVLPGYGRWGVWAPLALVVLRFCQGLGLGGEWGGAALLVAEYAPRGRRGRYSGYLQLGPSAGSALATGVFLAVSLGLSERQFQSWGWRLPFLGSLLLVGVGLFVRLRIAETPVFARALSRPSGEGGAPVLEVLRRHWRVVLLGTGMLSFGYALHYLSSTYALGYLTGQLGVSRTVLLALQLTVAPIGALTVWYSAGLSDRWGRRRTVLLGTALASCWSLLLFPVLETLRRGLMLLALAGTVLLEGVLLGPVAAYLPELFPTRVRYTGAALTYNLGGVIGGGTAPLLAARLTAAYGTAAPVGWYLAGLGAVAACCLLALPERGGCDLTVDHPLGDARATGSPAAVNQAVN
ncbi:MFS transporter [Kitasatospora viridis]|uniref:Putative MFS family arabinose efflux permease n=1 Tax=Kitasatospora viridis TaxID=281105 RepID=A0A561UFW0_9ACTN|nr:MFS transporter [Kitasatospora viridis]TWF98251.1 putative MFS family arabinose efflux permease [Kitasatospora viridis]